MDKIIYTFIFVFQNVCEVNDDEFCTGSHSGPFIRAIFDTKGEFKSFENRPIRSKYPVDFTAK